MHSFIPIHLSSKVELIVPDPDSSLTHDVNPGIESVAVIPAWLEHAAVSC